MRSPLFSVILPTYNRRASTISAVKSILLQSENDFEIIIVDDGSTDGTLEALEEIFDDQRIRCLSQQNSGPSAARNKGILSAKGKFITFLDSDDTFHVENFKNMKKEINDSPNYDIYFGILQFIRDDAVFYKPSKIYIEGTSVAEYILCNRGCILHSAFVVRTEHARHAMYDSNIRYGDDQDFILRLENNGARFKMVSHICAKIDDRHDDDRLSSAINPDERLKWLASMKPMLTNKAYFGDLGWTVAKAYSHQGEKIKAIKLFFSAIFRGCYSPKFAIVIGLQIFLSKKMYYILSTRLAKLGITP